MRAWITLALLALLMGGGGAVGSEVSSVQAAGLHGERQVAGSSPYVDQRRFDAEISAARKSYEAWKVREKGRKVKNAVLFAFIGAGVLMFIAKWLSFHRQEVWRVPAALWALLIFLGAIYFGVGAYFDVATGYAGVSSKAGFSTVSRDREPFFFYLAVCVNLALAAFLAWVAIRKVSGKGK